MSKKILFTEETHPILVEKLTKAGFSCYHFPNLTRNELKKSINIYFGLITRSKFTIDKDIINSVSPEFKFIGRVGAGMENIDVEYAEEKNITCFNSPEGNRDAVGEHALGLLLTLFNNINRANNEVRNGIWLREENRGLEIKGKTIGIIGYGNMGKAFAQRLSGFDARVIAYDKYKFNYSDSFVQEKSIHDLFEESDIISIHVPLTNETKFMINDEFINKFKKNIYIINTARGKVLKTDDLVKNLKSGKVIGAALDVLEYEKSSFENLHNSKQLPDAFKYLINDNSNVIITPHIAGWTHESNIKLSEVLADKIIAKYA